MVGDDPEEHSHSSAHSAVAIRRIVYQPVGTGVGCTDFGGTQSGCKHPEYSPATVGVANTLAIGDLFEDDSTLRVVRAEDKHSGSFSVTGSVGTVTVVTP